MVTELLWLLVDHPAPLLTVSTWTPLTGVWSALFGVTYGNGMFVAVGYQPYDTTTAIFSSPDAATWTPRTSPVKNGWLYGVAYGNGTFVAVGYYATNVNGRHRIYCYHPHLPRRGDMGPPTASPVTKAPLNAVAYGNGMFLVAGQRGYVGDYGPVISNLTILTSPEGVTWTPKPSPCQIGNFEAVAYGNGSFVAVGWNCSFSREVFTSPDGVTWTQRNLNLPATNFQELRGITYGKNMFVAVGRAGSPDVPLILTSPDGVTWTQRTSPATSLLLERVTYGNGIFVVVGEDAQGGCFTLTLP